MLRDRVAVWMTLCCLSSGLCNHIGLMDCGLDNLLLLGVEILGQILIKSRLFLLKTCAQLAFLSRAQRGSEYRTE